MYYNGVSMTAIWIDTMLKSSLEYVDVQEMSVEYLKHEIELALRILIQELALDYTSAAKISRLQ